MFPNEYAVVGWFKWIGGYNGWHLLFRLTINGKPDNQDGSRLGDRTLAVWAHPGQFYHPTTYSYVNMFMGGDANRHDNMQH